MANFKGLSSATVDRRPLTGRLVKSFSTVVYFGVFKIAAQYSLTEK